MSKAKSFLSKNAMLIVLVAVMILFEIALRNGNKGSLFSPSNLTNLIKQNGYVIILAAGMLLCILTGGNIDLAVGSTVCLVGAIGGVLMVNWHVNPYLSMLICLIVATLLGAWQAFWIAYVRVPPFVTTLSGMLVFRGIARLILGSKGISQFPKSFLNMFLNSIPGKQVDIETGLIQSDPSLTTTVTLLIGIGIVAVLVAIEVASRIRKQRKGYSVDSLLWMIVRLVVVGAVVIFISLRLGQQDGIPLTLVWLTSVVLLYTYFTQNTVPGRYLYALGGNEKAARLSGVDTKKMMFFAYTNMGFLAGVAALVVVARFDQAGTTAGDGYELDAIGACFVGGASAYGGVGTVGGAVIGAVFFGVLNMGMSILGWDPNLQRVVKGLVLLAAVVFDVISKNRKQSA